MFVMLGNLNKLLVIMNVEAYLKRIGYTGSRKPNLENLGALSLAHKVTVPYSNLQYFGGEKTNLDLEQLFDKMVTKGKGGTCYEINGLFIWLLRQLGYTVTTGRAKNFMPHRQQWSVDYFHLLPLVHLNGERYIVDPGFLVVGPMKVGHMVVHVEPHAIYRIRNAPDQDSCWFIMDRHKKTVLDQDGQILKQGPAPPGVATGRCDEECCREESSHWTLLHTLSLESKTLEDFYPILERHHDPSEDTHMNSNIILHLYDAKRFKLSFGDSYSIKENVDPVTDKVVIEKKFESNEEIERVAREVFLDNFDHPVKFFNRK